MSLFSRRGINDAQQFIPSRGGSIRSGTVRVTPDSALRHSGVWAALRTRADLISTLPLDCYKRRGGVQFEMPKTPFLTDPYGDGSGMGVFLYSTQFDLDRGGNTFGGIAKVDGYGKPAQIEPISADTVTIIGRGSEIQYYKFGPHKYEPREVWHEKQHTVSGLPVGLSPIAYAAWSLGAFLSAQQFATDWFQNGAHPTGTLRNTMQSTIDSKVIQEAKSRFKEATANGDIFVTGKDWEYSLAAASNAQASFLDSQNFGITEAARWFGVPADIIDSDSSTGNITYASVAQRDLQLLVIHLQPAITRREVALSAATPAPRFVKLNTDALLRMDPAGVTDNLSAQITARLRTPSEGRSLLNLPPLSDAEFNEFDRLFPPKLGAGMAAAGAFPLPFLNLPGVDNFVPEPPPAGVTP